MVPAARTRVGVVAYQGAVPEHLRMLERVGANAVPVKWPQDLDGLQGLILPGGESTTIGDLMHTYGLDQAIRDFVATGGAVYGTCAGAILLAQKIIGGTPKQPSLGILPVTVQRNGFGRQVDSCEVDLDIPVLGPEPFRTVFIRAPFFLDLDPTVAVLASWKGKTVAVQSGRHLATAFHPELTGDARFHDYFVKLATGVG